MVRSAGVGGLIFLQNGNLRRSKLLRVFVEAIFWFVKICFQTRGTNTK